MESLEVSLRKFLDYLARRGRRFLVSALTTDTRSTEHQLSRAAWRQWPVLTAPLQ